MTNEREERTLLRNWLRLATDRTDAENRGISWESMTVATRAFFAYPPPVEAASSTIHGLPVFEESEDGRAVEVFRTPVETAGHLAEIWPLDDGAGWRLTIHWPSGERETHEIHNAGDEFMATICDAVNAFVPPSPEAVEPPLTDERCSFTTDNRIVCSQPEDSPLHDERRWPSHPFTPVQPTPVEALPEGERWARLFHETYERLAPTFGYETRRESAVPWEDVPEDNRRLMTAVATIVSVEVARDAEERARTAEEWAYEYGRQCTEREKAAEERATQAEGRVEALERAVTNAKLEFDAIWRAVQVGSGRDDADAANEAGRIAENASRMMARALTPSTEAPSEEK